MLSTQYRTLTGPKWLQPVARVDSSTSYTYDSNPSRQKETGNLLNSTSSNF